MFEVEKGSIMRNEAEIVIDKYRDLFEVELSSLNGLIAIEDNSNIISILEQESVSSKDILDQETYIMGDGSYITRLSDEYWTGEVVDLFEVEDELNKVG